jgi:hypothetical protein
MKKLIAALSVLMLLGSASSPFGNFSSCYGKYTPVFMERSELEKSVSYKAGERALVDPGKICYRAPYIFVNERYKGIHVINNSDPANPLNEGFIVAPGCIDMAMKGNTLYIDNAVDLVAFDFATKTVTERIRDLFPEPPAPDRSVYDEDRPQNLILTGWIKTNELNIK